MLNEGGPFRAVYHADRVETLDKLPWEKVSQPGIQHPVWK
jgi:hypothetical protein